MAKGKSQSGGKAEATGANYETLVLAWYSHMLLIGSGARLPFDLPANAVFRTITSQSDAPVDDVNASTSDDGIVFVQAKRTVNLSTGEDAPLTKALEQFVRQHKACAENDRAHAWSRPLNRRKDRLVLATRTQSSSKIIEILPRLLRGLRDRSDVDLLSQIATSEAEKEVADAIELTVKAVWQATYGSPASSAQLGELLRLIWVQELDLEEGKRDWQAAIDRLRTDLLDDPAQADNAFSQLYKLAARLRADRSATDRASLLTFLADNGVSLKVLPDFRQDIAALKKWTATRLMGAASFTHLIESKPALTIDRALWAPVERLAREASFLVVGEPGTGKSGFTYRLAQEALSGHRDVVFIPVDLLHVDRFAELQVELGINHPLNEVLSNWPGAEPGVLVIDALDAARKAETQTILRDVVSTILRTPGCRFHVVASVRKYDLRQGTEWAKLFRGLPPIAAHADPEFSHVRHVSVKQLTDAEIEQTATPFPALLQLYQDGSDKLRDLLKNIFNLHLLADLLDQGVAGTVLKSIRTQPELLDSYWQHRIRRDDGKHDARESTLTTMLEEMVAAQTLQVARDKIRSRIDTEALVDLERHGILRAEEQGGKPDENVLLFSHHVLFDYSVSRLLFWRGRDPARLVEAIRKRRELALMLSPSLSLALVDTWSLDGQRKAFWDLAFALAKEVELPGVAQLAAPMVAAELSATIDDVEPLFARWNASDSDRAAAQSFARSLVGALFVRLKGGTTLLGPEAGPWMDFAARLAETSDAEVSGALRALIANAADKI